MSTHSADNRFSLNSNIMGIFWMILAGLFFSAMVGLIKQLGHRIPSYEIVFFRSTIQVMVLTVVLWRIGFVAALKTERPLLHGFRTLIAVLLINCNFYAFTKLPIAEVTAIGFSRNLFLALLAVPILAEKVTTPRLIALVVGFGGILLIARPGGGSFDGVMLIALAGAALGAIMMIMIRKLTTTDSNIVMMTYPAVGIVLATAIPTAVSWVDPTTHEFFLLILMSLLGIVGQWSMIQAFRLGEATAISSAGYTRIVFATVIGYIFFAELPDAMTISGIAVIVVSNLLLIYQEGRVKGKGLAERVSGL